MIKGIRIFYHNGGLAIVGPATELLELLCILLDSQSFEGRSRAEIYGVFERIGGAV